MSIVKGKTGTHTVVLFTAPSENFSGLFHSSMIELVTPLTS